MTKLAMNNTAMSCKLYNGERDDPLGSDQDEFQQDVLNLWMCHMCIHQKWPEFNKHELVLDLRSRPEPNVPA